MKRKGFLHSKERESCDNLIKVIQPLNNDQKESVRENLRTEYQAVSGYTIHYSNVRVVLSTFFISISFYIFFSQITAENPAILLFGAGFLIMIFGFLLNLVLTRLMQGGLRRLVKIEYILNSIAGKTSIGIQELINYFSPWAGKSTKETAKKDKWRERLSVCYIVLVGLYLSLFILGLVIRCKDLKLL